jgi:hypothetical protein
VSVARAKGVARVRRGLKRRKKARRGRAARAKVSTCPAKPIQGPNWDQIGTWSADVNSPLNLLALCFADVALIEDTRNPDYPLLT